MRFESACVFFLAFCNVVFGNTRLLFANISGNRNVNGVMASCASDDFNDAIAWVTPLQSEFAPRQEVPTFSSEIKFNWNQQHWATELSNKGMFGPITDYTWETLPIYMSSASALRTPFKIKKIETSLRIINQFELNFSFLGTSNAQIYLCDNATLSNAACSIFILGGWDGYGSVIRKCERGKAPQNSNDPACNNLVSKVDHQPIFSENMWSQISLQYFDRKLNVFVNNQEILSYVAKQEKEFENYIRLFVHSYTRNALWKYHEYYYFEARLPFSSGTTAYINSDWFRSNSNELCLSLLAHIPTAIQLDIFQNNDKTPIVSKVFQSDQSLKWQYLELSTTSQPNDFYYLRINYNSNDYVAIRNISIHSCETTRLHYSAMEYQVKDAKKVKCTSLKGQTEQLSVKKSTSNPDCGEHNDCNVCLSIYNSTECPHKLICRTNNCYCTMGYYGDYCEKQCEVGWYGFNCKLKCGECKEIGDCQVQTGICTSGCKDNYVTETCHAQDYPILRNISSIPSTCVHSCTITLYDTEFEYNSMKIPRYYYTQIWQGYFANNRESELFPISEKDIVFKNLLKSVHYSFQVILCIEDNKQSCYLNDLKIFDLQTACEDINVEQIQFKNIDRSNSVGINNYNEATQCNLNQYSTKIFDKRNVNIQNGRLQSSQLELYNLDVYSAYSYVIYRNGRIIHNITFITDESVPYPVQRASINSTTSSQLIVVWDQPTPTQGVITHYIVEWKWVGKIGCSSTTERVDIQSKTVEAQIAELNDLKPYSTYNIQIYAFTKKGKGTGSSLNANTKRDNSGISNNIQYDTRQTEKELILNINVPCADWNGPFFMLVNITCTSDWCADTQRNESYSVGKFNAKFVIHNLLSYTNYILDIYLKQEDSQLWTNTPQETREIMTLPGVPHQVPFFDVYELSESSLSLRWTEPYPPTGKLISFVLSYSYATWRKWSEMTTVKVDAVNASKCVIWENMYCKTLIKLYEGYQYHVKITANNDNIYPGSTERSVKISTAINYPEPPLNVRALWDDSRMLTLQWEHPNRTNGFMKGFNIILNNIRKEMKVQNPQFLYSFKANFQCTPSLHNISVTLQTINSKFASAAVTTIFHCPVFKPRFQANPTLTLITNRSLDFLIPEIKDSEIISNFYILVVINQPEKEGDCKDNNGKLLDSYIPIKNNQVCFILSEYSESAYGDIKNAKKSFEFKQLPKFNFESDAFDVGILLVNEYMGERAHNWYPLMYDSNGRVIAPVDPDTEGAFNFWWLLLIFALIALFVSLGVLWHLRLSKLFFSPAPVNFNDDNKQPDLIPLTGTTDTILGSLVPTTVPQVVASSTVRPSISVKPKIRNVPVSKFSEYVKEAIENGELQKQHEKFERGMLKPSTCGQLPVNYPKNRYKNLIAYDDTRVQLKCLNGRPSTDYINANYIQSPICQNAYIATQGPIDSTIYDFWFMVHTEGVQYIIMLANVIEDGKKKVSPYWPDYKKMNKILTLDDIEVCATGIKTYYSYEARTFNLKFNDITTEVTQLHFTSWPDHGIPLYPESLMPFVKEILEIPHNSEHPILVHCSAGVGRTGTILLIDICLRQAQLTKHVDAFKELGLLRNQRPNLVDNIEQYKLVHLVLLDYFCPLQTTFSCIEYNVFYAGLTDTILQELLQYINKTLWQESAIIPEPRYILKIESEKNRDPEIIPALYGVLYLRPQVNNDSTYINAVTVDGFNLPKRFIATQHPLSNTMDDFWRLINEQDIKLIISLQPTYDVTFWENGGDFTSPNGTLLEHFETAECAELNTHTVFLSFNGGEKTEVKIIEMNGWEVDADVPSTLSNLLAVWREVNGLKLVDSRIVVMCRNGATATGLYIAMHNLLDRIQAEQVVNICKCVRIIRRSRKQFVTTVEQLKLLHRAAALLLSEFEIYANFTPIVLSTAQE